MDILTRADVIARVREHFSQPGAELAYETPGEYAVRTYTIEGDAGEYYEYNEGGCVYRGQSKADSSIRCAIGCLIPDELYLPEWETKNIGYGPMAALEAAYLLDEDVDLNWLELLQDVHDQTAADEEGVSEFLRRLHNFAACGDEESE